MIDKKKQAKWECRQCGELNELSQHTCQRCLNKKGDYDMIVEYYEMDESLVEQYYKDLESSSNEKLIEIWKTRVKNDLPIEAIEAIRQLASTRDEELQKLVYDQISDKNEEKKCSNCGIDLLTFPKRFRKKENNIFICPKCASNDFYLAEFEIYKRKMFPFIIGSFLVLSIPLFILWLLTKELINEGFKSISYEIIFGLLFVMIISGVVIYNTIKGFRLLTSEGIELKISGIKIFKRISTNAILFLTISAVGGIVLGKINEKVDLVSLGWSIGKIFGIIIGTLIFFRIFFRKN